MNGWSLLSMEAIDSSRRPVKVAFEGRDYRELHHFFPLTYID